MKLPEYKAKALFDACGIQTMPGIVIDDLSTAEKMLAESGLKYPLVVKAQVQVGGRGKAGGIRVAKDEAEALKHCKDMLHTELKGYTINQLLLVEFAEHGAEWYLSVMLDRLSKRTQILFCADGGVDIEETVKNNPEKTVVITLDPFVGVEEYHARYMLSRANQPMSLLGEFYALLKKLVHTFSAHDCMLVEINPLIPNADGTFTALDGKVDIDDSALYRQQDILAYRDDLEQNELVKLARAHDFLYIPMDEGAPIAVTSNGSGMLMSCIDLICKEGMQVAAALDLGGGATAERIQKALTILFSTPGVKAVLINIFGGITRCDEVANGIRLMMEGAGDDKIIIVRMEGTNKEEGLSTVRAIKNGDIVCVDGLRESIAALCERRDRI